MVPACRKLSLVGMALMCFCVCEFEVGVTCDLWSCSLLKFLFATNIPE